eukprot:3438726-Lingulodinium_polyedra.AAC.1
MNSGGVAAPSGPRGPSPQLPAPPLLDRYFDDRTARILGAQPLWGTVLALVLEPKGSAPGIDGLPYE